MVGKWVDMTEQHFDAVVIGAGAGGLFAAARLTRQGYRTLVVERLDKVGGRASTDEIDGFKVNNGAIVIEVGGITEQTCREVGARFDIREPTPPILYRIGGKDIDVTGGGWGFLLSKLTRQGAKLVKGIGAARNDSGLPEDEISTAEWVSKYTKNEGVHGIFRNMCASVFAVGSEDLPARVFLTYFTRKSAFKRFGFHPEGTIGLWRALAEVVENGGGQVWCCSTVDKILVEDDTVTGVEVTREGGALRVNSRLVISDVGPTGTVSLVGEENVPTDYRALVQRGDRPTSMISVNFASRERLIDVPGMLSFASSRRLAYIANFTDLCPEMAPEGWHLYVGTAVPKPSLGGFDEAIETGYLLDDLRDNIGDFDRRARILNIAITRDGWPPQRAVAGFDLPHETPIQGLWNVGDGVKEYANGGTTACAETAKIVVEKIVSGCGA
ncbi:amine oxidase [Mycobacteroides abscessus subsp. massiliense]|uniref:Amine oxidase n=3 Tax=Mycobacteroides abscessus TaxID=36809 RepID=A0A9Q7WKD9_9MYCO|nr:amine oxidase [Mycobacteroides abscessus]SHU42434.1 amine oxidase [Mycobacteroides abscessus subsp. bolletii]SKE52805.1 amine oxidase [Mycobacteroides abscessus subsp. massiliense]SLI32679.1 amine oxidase [Mycobacteroides abscessus subsp. abscessus]BBB40469.1 oxidoreductase [Mycobacteroides abscessus subsp. bolletii BD]